MRLYILVFKMSIYKSLRTQVSESNFQLNRYTIVILSNLATSKMETICTDGPTPLIACHVGTLSCIVIIADIEQSIQLITL